MKLFARDSFHDLTHFYSKGYCSLLCNWRTKKKSTIILLWNGLYFTQLPASGRKQQLTTKVLKAYKERGQVLLVYYVSCVGSVVSTGVWERRWGGTAYTNSIELAKGKKQLGWAEARQEVVWSKGWVFFFFCKHKTKMTCMILKCRSILGSGRERGDPLGLLLLS